MKFTRHKLVTIYQEGPDLLTAHGVLEDDLYGLEIDLTLSISDLEITKIKGQWNRAENAECVRGIPFLQEAVGFRMGEGFTARVQKVIGRKACRHFADILLETCYTVREAAYLIRGERAQGQAQVGLNSRETATSVPGQAKRVEIPEQNRAGGMISPPQSGKGRKTDELVIDLHVHSFPASSCSSVSVEALIEEAQKIGLDGFCLTEHNHLWNPQTIADLRRKTGFLILRGNEITTDQGDILVFGLEKDIQGIISLEALRSEVSRAGGFMIAAHPFRGFLTFGIGQLGLTAEKAMERPLWKGVDALEVLNSKVTEKENALAAQVAMGLKKPATGGSDAHSTAALGIYATRFFRPIEDEKGLIAALQTGNFQPLAYRKEQQERDGVHGTTD
jgi:predicted metal-dependent phosphoesterase TrpH